MHEITFDGKQYSKANVLAKELGYTADYIGQLCRAGKVDARLVGRAWFVSRDSVLQHQAQRYEYQRTQQSVEMKKSEVDKSTDIKVSRINVPPVHNKHLRKHFYAHQTSDATLRIAGPAQYEPDTSPLVPPVTKSRVVTIPVDLDGALSVKIVPTVAPRAVLRPESLPTVYMRGSLTVHDVPESGSKALGDSDGDSATSSTVASASPTPIASPVVRKPVPVRASSADQSEISDMVQEPVVVELPIRPLEVLLSRPVAISVATAGALAVALLVLETIIEIGVDTGANERWQVANVVELFR
jgi:hypothetical protein